MTDRVASLEAWTLDRELLRQLTSMDELKKHLAAQGPQVAILAEEVVWGLIVEDLLLAGYGDKDVQALYADINYLGRDAFLKDMRFSNPRARANITRLVSGLSTTDPCTWHTEVGAVNWDQVCGLEEAKRSLQELICLPVTFPHMFEKFGMETSGRVLFYGPPGCGKTLMAKAVATELKANFLSITGSELLIAWYGNAQAPDNVFEGFDKARAAAPCVLFFDELDSIGTTQAHNYWHSQGGAGHAGDKMMNQLLTSIDRLRGAKNVVFIGATTCPELLDGPLLKRLDHLFYIGLPDLPARQGILEAELKMVPVAPNVPIPFIATLLEGFSGKEIADICQRIRKAAIRDAINAEKHNGSEHAMDTTTHNEVGREHFEEALAAYRRTVYGSDLAKYDQFRKKFDFTSENYFDRQKEKQRIFWPSDGTEPADDGEDLYA